MEDAVEYPSWGKEFLDESKGNVDVENRQNFSVWVCQRHNAVNSKLGKPLFSCDYSDLKKRWGPP